jgi:hypothetical protein
MSIHRTTREGPDDDRVVGRGLNDGWSAKVNRKAHREDVYSTKGETGVSWYQTEPRLTLQLIRSVAPTARGRIIGVGVEPCLASSLGRSRCSRRPALVTRRARPSLCWTAAILPRRQPSRCRCYRTWPHPAMCASSVAGITWPQSAASSRSIAERISNWHHCRCWLWQGPAASADPVLSSAISQFFGDHSHAPLQELRLPAARELAW